MRPKDYSKLEQPPKESLTDLLLEYYGNLKYTLENSNDYFTKVRLEKKLNAINILIGMPEVKLVEKLNKQS